jgi:hypothetical protein
MRLMLSIALVSGTLGCPPAWVAQGAHRNLEMQ